MTLDYPKIYGKFYTSRKIIPRSNVYTIETCLREDLIIFLNTFYEKFDPKKIFAIKYFPNNHFMKDCIKGNCIEKILITGSIDKKGYIERYNFKSISDTDDNFVLQSERYDQDVYREYIRSYLAVYAGPASWIHIWKRKGLDIPIKFITAKYFEICAVGSLLVADDVNSHQLESWGFIDGKTCIYINKDNYKKKSNFILDPENRELIDKIRKAGQKMVRSNYSEKKIFKGFCDIVNKIVNGKSTNNETDTIKYKNK